MKKIYTLLIILTLCAAVTCSSAQICNNIKTTANSWTGSIRIEGKNSTVWDGIVSVGETYFDAKNVDTGEFDEYYISYPSVLGAFVEASVVAGFLYVIEYWPSWDAFLVKTIDDDSDWWHYWVDFELPMVGMSSYELTEGDDEVLIGYLESWTAHALKVSVDKSEVVVNKEFTISVYNESGSPVEDATVIIGTTEYNTNSDGTVKIKLSKKANYNIYSEKDGFVRSEQKNINVKFKNPIIDYLFEQLLILIDWIKKIFNIGVE